MIPQKSVEMLLKLGVGGGGGEVVRSYLEHTAIPEAVTSVFASMK